MKKMIFSKLDYLSMRKTTKKERFLAEMEQIVPFARLAAVTDECELRTRGSIRPQLTDMAKNRIETPSKMEELMKI